MLEDGHNQTTGIEDNVVFFHKRWTKTKINLISLQVVR